MKGKTLLGYVLRETNRLKYKHKDEMERDMWERNNVRYKEQSAGSEYRMETSFRTGRDGVVVVDTALWKRIDHEQAHIKPILSIETVKGSEEVDSWL